MEDQRDVYYKDGKKYIEGGDWWYNGDACFARLKDPNLHYLRCSGFVSHTGFCLPCKRQMFELMDNLKPEGYTIQEFCLQMEETMQEMRNPHAWKDMKKTE